jgi:hypothetical protein
MRKLLIMGLAAAFCMSFAASKALAVDISVAGKKLIIVDKTASTGAAKAVYVVKDPNVTKGTATDVATISSQLDIYYGASHGTWVNPSGANWLVNKDTVAKYVNKLAPTGGSTKVSVIKPAKLLKNVGKSLGDSAIDISAAPPAVITTVYTVNNGGVFRHCSTWDGTVCSHKSIAAGTGWKLACKVSAGAACPGSPSGAFVD